jgi:hypothetical protein
MSLADYIKFFEPRGRDSQPPRSENRTNVRDVEPPSREPQAVPPRRGDLLRTVAGSAGPDPERIWRPVGPLDLAPDPQQEWFGRRRR